MPADSVPAWPGNTNSTSPYSLVFSHEPTSSYVDIMGTIAIHTFRAQGRASVNARVMDIL